MKPNRPLTDVAARVLRAEAAQEDQASRESRAKAVDGMVHAMRRQKQRKRIMAGAGAAAVAVAAAVMITLGARRPSVDHSATVVVPAAPLVRGVASVSHEGNRTAVQSGTALSAGDQIFVPAASVATIALSNGTRIVLKDEASCTLVTPSPATTFDLTAGAIHADVAKLGVGERFVIRTADAEIEVRGTSFDVSHVASVPSCGEGTTTRVAVREGVVAVRAHGQETLVHANEVWPRDCASGAPVSPAPPASSATARAQPSSAVPSPPPKSELAAQNDLFESALAKKRSGDAPGAVAGFEQLLARYPNTHLAQSARAERMKLLRGYDQDRARAAARDYLERYPAGFARADANLILAP